MTIFDQPLPVLDRWAKGDPITADHLNEPVTAIKTLARGIGLPSNLYDAARFQNTVMGRVQLRFKVQFGDYLECVEWDGVTEGATLYVAKPYLLRQTPFDTKTRNSITYAYTSVNERTATDASSNTETQVIVPSYVANDVVYAINGITGDLQIQQADTAGATTDLVFIDMNLDGRAWAKKFE